MSRCKLEIWLALCAMLVLLPVEAHAADKCQGDRDQLAEMDQHLSRLEKSQKSEDGYLEYADERLAWDKMWLPGCKPVLDDLTRQEDIIVQELKTECERARNEERKLSSDYKQRKTLQSEREEKIKVLRIRRDAVAERIELCERHEAEARGVDDPLDCAIISAAVSGKWDWFAGQIVTLNEDGSAVSHNRENKQLNQGSWECLGEGIVLNWMRPGRKYTDILQLSNDGKKLSGKNQFGTPVSGTKQN